MKSGHVGICFVLVILLACGASICPVAAFSGDSIHAGSSSGSFSGAVYGPGSNVPIASLFGGTVRTDCHITITLPAEIGNGIDVRGIALTTPDGKLTRIVGAREGDTIVFSDYLADWELGTWKAQPVFAGGFAPDGSSGFATVSPSYMYGDAAYFTVVKADSSNNIAVAPVSTPALTETPSPVEIVIGEETSEAVPEIPATSQSPAPVLSIVLALCAIPFFFRRKE